MTVPIACSLAAPAARAQLAEWRELLTSSAVATDRISPTELSFRLRDDLARLGEIAALAQREKACCPFFDFAIQIASDAVRLTISVPEEAAGVLDGLAQLRNS